MTSDDRSDTAHRGWGELFSGQYRNAVLVLAGGVLLYAMNVFLTSSLLPSVVADIGGGDLYAWAMTAFLVMSVVSSLLVGRVLAARGARSSYAIGFGVFAVGSVIATVAPSMPVLLIGRAVQGAGGGLLAGLGFAVIRHTLPEHLWSRSLGLNSAMWGVGNIVGPTVGGLFAQLHIWRWAMVLLVALSIGLGTLAVRTLPAAAEQEQEVPPFPVLSLVAVAGAAAAVSVASILSGTRALLLIVLAVLLGVGFVLHERRAHARVLPAITYRGGNALKWVYLSMALLAVGSTTETFLPLFGQQLGRLDPLLAGLLGASLSWGWSVGAIASSNVDDLRRRAILRVTGPVLLAVGLAAYGLLQATAPAAFVIVLWFVALFVAGAGIGSAFQHGVTAAMASTDDAAESTRAATGVNTVQLMSNALGSAVAGVLVNLGATVLTSAHLLAFAYTAVAVVGIVTAVTANVRMRASSEPGRDEVRSRGCERAPQGSAG